MALEPYSSCPCGSGKKFKWCCQPIYMDIDKAFKQEADGQHDAALVTMDEVTAAHPANPEAWGRKAELLYRNGKVDDAEAALQKAFDINANYPFGFLLRGLFRQEEGELGGALLLFRKAAEAYDPEAHDQLAHVYGMIGECELKLNRPVATRAALAISLHFQPSNDDLRQALDGYFGEKSALPMAARREYKFKPAGNLAPERKAAWDRALGVAATGRLSDAAKAFWEQTEQDANNAAAWYNLALARAWLGDNAGALEAVDRYVNLEADETLAAEAWALGEALRLGHGMEQQADLIEYAAMHQIKDPRPVSLALQEWQNQKRLIVLQAREDQPVMSALVLEKVTSLTADPASAPAPKLGAYVLIVADRIRLWHTNREMFDKVRAELMEKAGPALASGPIEEHPANFGDALSSALVFPISTQDKAFAEQAVRRHMETYFEEQWLHRPLKALNHVPPVDAAGSGALRKKLRGVVQFLEECAAVGHQPYDFGRLRRKLGLEGGASAAAAASGGRDFGAMSAADLAALAAETLSEEELEQAFQAALKLDARELAGKFALALVGKPAPGARPDRFPWYNHLAQLAVQDGKPDAALEFLGEGAKTDAAHNEGKRQNDYDLRRGQIQAKSGNADAAAQTFQTLIDRSPGELKLRGSAAEAMLSQRQGAKALQFAEAGLVEARKQNNRDSEQYFLELAAAARKQS